MQKKIFRPELGPGASGFGPIIAQIGDFDQS